MSKLIAFKDDGKQCWSRLQLDNGDPIWIGIAQSGIVVKKSRSGILGAQIFKEKEIIAAGDTAKLLYENAEDQNLPDEMTNIVLMAFTQAALDSDSAATLAAKIAAARNAS